MSASAHPSRDGVCTATGYTKKHDILFLITFSIDFHPFFSRILSNNLSISYHLCAREVYGTRSKAVRRVQHMHKPRDPRVARARRAAYCTGLLVTRRGAGYPRAISQRSRASRVRATPGVRYAASAGAAGEGGCVTACVIGECTRLGSRPPRSRALGGRGGGDEGGGVGGARVGSHRAEGCGGAVEPEGARGGDGVL